VSPVLLLVGIFLVALNLRAAIASLPPEIETIRHALGLNGVAAGMLTALPVVCMGLFAPVAQRVGHRIGNEMTTALAVATIGVGTFLRLAGANVGLLYLGTFLAGIGIAVAGTLLPALVKEYFASRAGLVTGIYTFALMGGAAAAAGFSVPLADALGSWQRSLASWTVLAIASLAIWLPVMMRVHSGVSDVTTSRPPMPLRSARAWRVTAYIAANSIVFYSLLAWLAPTFQVDHGWSAGRAGLLLAVFSFVQAPTALLVSALRDRMSDRRPLYYLMVGSTLIGLVALMLVPTTMPWLFAVILGAGSGGGFALGLVLLVDQAQDTAQSASLSAMAFLVSYSVAAIGPVLLGGLRDVTGSFQASFAILAAVSAAQLVLTVQFRPRVGTPVPVHAGSNTVGES
jgi:CP family cyanate transporter-like MFS transporter